MPDVAKPLFALVLLLAVAACGSDGDTAASSTSERGITTTADVNADSTSDTSAVTTTTVSDESTTSSGLVGEPIDFGPRAGDTLAVIGVAHDDVLNVRAAPGVDAEIATTLAPLADDVVAQGNTRQLPNSFWIELDNGWVNLSYVGYLGVVTDETAAVVDDLGEIPISETMVDLGFVVAETFASEDPASEIVQVTPPTIGDLGEITFDVIGLGDDALAGWRVHVFGAEDDAGEAFGLMSVEVTALCSRGVTEDLLCA